MSSSREAASPQIVLLSPRQAEAASAILARSHADYPSFRHLFPDDQRRARALQALFTGIARDAARLGSAYGALGSDGELRRVALWLAPGQFPRSSLRQLRGAGWMLSVPARRPRVVSSIHEDRGERSARSSRRPALVPGDDGRRPRLQRHGLGGRLLEPVLAIADHERVDCYLETADPRNAEYYARHGFVVENPALQLVPDGPAHVAMRRRSPQITKSDRKR